MRKAVAGRPVVGPVVGRVGQNYNHRLFLVRQGRLLGFRIQPYCVCPRSGIPN